MIFIIKKKFEDMSLKACGQHPSSESFFLLNEKYQTVFIAFLFFLPLDWGGLAGKAVVAKGRTQHWCWESCF